MSLSAIDLAALARPSVSDKADMDDLLACLLVVAKLHGRATTANHVLAGLPVDQQGLTPALFSRAASRAGLQAIVVKTLAHHLVPEQLPALVIRATGQPMVLVSRDAISNTAQVILPGIGEDQQNISIEALEQLSSDHCILLQPDFDLDQRVESGTSPLREHWFWSAMRENLPAYREVIFAGLVINLFALVVPLFTMNVYDRVVPNRALETLWMLSLGVVIVLVFDLVLKTVRARFVDEAGSRVDIRLSARIMERVLDTRLTHRPASVGSFASNLRAFESVRDFVTSASLAAFVDLPFAIIFLAVIAWISPVLVLPVAAGIAVALLHAWPVQARMRTLSQRTHAISAQRNATLIEGLAGLETVKALGLESRVQARWEQAVRQLAHAGTGLRALATSASHITAFIQQLVTVGLILMGVHLIADNQLSLGALIAATMLAARVMAPIAQVSAMLTQLHMARTSLDSLDTVMSQPVERPCGTRYIHREGLRGTIEFRNVSFRYPGQDEDALTQVSFRLTQGQRLAVMGRSGSGKTSILRLLLGLYQPAQGAVLVDGIDVRQWDPAELRRHIGYVPQEAVLMFGTLRDNIAMGHPLASDQDVIRASAIADISDFVNRHPRGFDMPVGERGETLSGGQRKAVALARGVVGEKSMLLMDEPTDSLDHTAEERIRHRLRDYVEGMTMVLITHRSSLLDLADTVLVLDQGKVVAFGARESVLDSLRGGRISKAA